ncbi:MAG TPA: glycosyltransferase family 39 protein [Vitreimonas sp.]|nr:glycosyltransferase family 39 protein [Vitreimonas sp.]
MLNFFKNYSLWLILILALGLRLPLLSGSFWLDEAAQVWESDRSWGEQLQIKEDFQPPLIHLIVHAALYVHRDEWWLRTFAALIPGLIAVWGTYQLGRQLTKSEVGGAVAASLLATSSFHIFYSQELRPYALPTMWAVLSWWALVNFQPWHKAKWWWSFYALTTIAGLYSSYLYPFLILSQVTYGLFFHWRWWKTFVISYGVAGLAFLPWLPKFLEQLQVGGMVRQQMPGWEEVVSIPQLKSLPLVVAKFLFGVLNVEVTAFFVGVSVVMVSGLVLSLWILYKHARTARPPQALMLTLIWLLVPLITSWIISFWIPVLQPKRVLYLLPGFYLFVSILVSEIKLNTKKMSTVVPYLLLVTLLLTNAWSTFNYYTQPTLQRENWRALYADVAARYSASDTVLIFSFPGAFPSWEWYDSADYPFIATGVLHVDQVKDLRATLQPLHNYRYVIIFDYLSDLSDPHQKIRAEVESYGYQSIEIIEYPVIGFVRVYAAPNVTLSQK